MSDTRKEGKYLFVRFLRIIGEDEIFKVLLLRYRRRPEDAVHRYFRDYFLDDTVVGKKSRLYWRADYTTAVAVSSWNEVPEEDAEVLKKYVDFEDLVELDEVNT